MAQRETCRSGRREAHSFAEACDDYLNPWQERALRTMSRLQQRLEATHYCVPTENWAPAVIALQRTIENWEIFHCWLPKSIKTTRINAISVALFQAVHSVKMDVYLMRSADFQ